MQTLLPMRNVDEELSFRIELAKAIVSVTSDEHEQNLLVSIARHETRFIERLAAPNCICKKNECDGGRAKGTWQIIPYNKVEREQLCVSLEGDARLALERIHESELYCRHLPENERLAIYARGTCSSEEGRRLSRIRWIK